MRLLVSLLVMINLMLVSNPAKSGSVADFQGRVVTAIGIQGSGLTSGEVLSQIEIKTGDPFSLAAVRKSVRVLYNMGLFGQVRVTARPVGQGVELNIVLDPIQRILSVQFFGNDAIASSELVRLSRSSRGDEFDRWKLDSAVAEMRALYRRRGYRQTRIVPKLLGSPQGDVEIQFFIQEGPPTRISHLLFEGNTLVRPNRLLEIMNLEEGSILDQDKLKAGVEALAAFYKRQGYLEAKVRSSQISAEALAQEEELHIHVATGKKVIFSFSGNEVIHERELQNLITSAGKVQFNKSTLQDLSGRLEDLYRRRGYARVKVESRILEPPGIDEKHIIFGIDEGPQVQVRQIRFEGNRAFSQERLQAIVEDAMLEALPQSLVGQHVDRGDVDEFAGGYPWRNQQRRADRPQGFLFDLRPESMYLREPFEKALGSDKSPGQIEDLYRSQGYLEVQVGPPLFSYDGSGAKLYVTVPIKEGPQSRIESISFEGNEAIESTELLQLAETQGDSVRPGGPYSQYGLERLREVLARAYASRGYVYCQMEQRAVFSTDRTLAQVLYVIREGPQVHVRRVIVRGNVVTKRGVFDLTLALRTGEIFSPEKVNSSQEDLMNLGVFSGVDIKMMDPEITEAEKDVVVSIRERLPQSINFIPGVSSAEGLRLELDYTHLNLFGYAVELVAKAKASYQVFYPFLSSIRDRYEKMSFGESLAGWVVTGLHFPRIWLFRRPVAARVDLLGLQDHTSSYDLRKVSLVHGMDFSLGSGLALTIQAELEYIWLNCQVLGCSGATNPWMRYDSGELFLGSFQPEFSWDLRDNPFQPHRGLWLSFRPELAKSLLPGRQVLYLKLNGLVTGYVPLGKAITLALSLRAGAIFHLLSNSKTPSHKLFFLGGRNSVRSYQEDALIPQDLSPPCLQDPADPKSKTCVSPGGNVFINLKGEFRFPLIPESVDGALFVDLGNLWIEVSHIKPLELRPAVGLGVRFVTPIGPVAFDFGINVAPDKARNEDTWNLHFNIGVF